MSQALSTKAVSSTGSQAKRLAAIAVLCATRGAQYKGLKTYRSL
jgi:hypothetical protein